MALVMSSQIIHDWFHVGSHETKSLIKDEADADLS